MIEQASFIDLFNRSIVSSRLQVFNQIDFILRALHNLIVHLIKYFLQQKPSLVHYFPREREPFSLAFFSFFTLSSQERRLTKSKHNPYLFLFLFSWQEIITPTFNLVSTVNVTSSMWFNPIQSQNKKEANNRCLQNHTTRIHF